MATAKSTRSTRASKAGSSKAGPTKAGPSKARRAPPPSAPPGEAQADALIDRIIRVDHAGEYGAKRIYEGQLAILGNSPKASVIEHMADQEAHHLATFERLVAERGIRPSILHPLWHIGGFALGAGTALLGERAAMACTVAVEEVIDEHYARQAEALGDSDPELSEAIEQFRAEEAEHRDLGLEHEAEQAPGYRVLSAVIKRGSRAAIWLAERF